MKKPRVVLGLMLSAVLLASMQFAAPTGAQNEPWISIDKVMVNKLGGVSVEGLHSASPVYDQLVSGSGLPVTYEDDEGWHQTTIYADANDVVLILSNPDNFVVRQPAGRKGMITAEHVSTRAHPAFSNAPPGFFFPGWESRCEGATCRWVTDRMSYFGNEPLFVYSPDGRFKAGLLSVEVVDIGYWVEVYETDGTFKAGGSFAYETFSQRTIKAVSYRN